MNIKKCIIILSFISFFFISSVDAACSFQSVKECNREGLISLIKELIKIRQANDKNQDVIELTKNGFRLLAGDWYYKYEDLNKNNDISCAYENVSLRNILTGEQFYIFDQMKSYGDLSCLGNNFKVDSTGKNLYFIRSYEFCRGSYYEFNLTTRNLKEIEIEADSRENGCFDFDYMIYKNMILKLSYNDLG